MVLDGSDYRPTRWRASACSRSVAVRPRVHDLEDLAGGDKGPAAQGAAYEFRRHAPVDGRCCPFLFDLATTASRSEPEGMLSVSIFEFPYPAEPGVDPTPCRRGAGFSSRRASPRGRSNSGRGADVTFSVSLLSRRITSISTMTLRRSGKRFRRFVAQRGSLVRPPRFRVVPD